MAFILSLLPLLVATSMMGHVNGQSTYYQCQPDDSNVIIAIDESNSVSDTEFNEQIDWISGLLEIIDQRWTIGIIAYHSSARIIYSPQYNSDTSAFFNQNAIKSAISSMVRVSSPDAGVPSTALTLAEQLHDQVNNEGGWSWPFFILMASTANGVSDSCPTWSPHSFVVSVDPLFDASETDCRRTYSVASGSAEQVTLAQNICQANVIVGDGPAYTPVLYSPPTQEPTEEPTDTECTANCVDLGRNMLRCEYSVVQDAWIEENVAIDTSYDTRLLIGRHAGYPLKRSLIQFEDVNLCPVVSDEGTVLQCEDNSVHMAIMYLHYYLSHATETLTANEAPDLDHEILVYQVLKEWSESGVTHELTGIGSDTWDQPYLATDGSDADRMVSGRSTQFFPSFVDRWIEFDVTVAVQNWLREGNSNNNGLLIKVANEDADGRDIRFYSKDENSQYSPRLYVFCKAN